MAKSLSLLAHEAEKERMKLDLTNPTTTNPFLWRNAEQEEVKRSNNPFLAGNTTSFRAEEERINKNPFLENPFLLGHGFTQGSVEGTLRSMSNQSSMHIDNNSANPQDIKLKENGNVTILQGPITVKVDKKSEKKSKEKQKENSPPSIEWQYLYTQSELCRKGIPLDVQVVHVLPEKSPWRIPYPIELYFQETNKFFKKASRTKEDNEGTKEDPKSGRVIANPTPKPISHKELKKKLEALPDVEEGEQSTFLPGQESYPGQEIEYRYIALKGWLEHIGEGTDCGDVKPQTNIPKELVDSLGATADLQFVHDTYSKLKPSFKYPSFNLFPQQDNLTPEQKYQSELTSFRLGRWLEKKERKEGKKKQKRKKTSKTGRTLRTLGLGIFSCISM